LHRYACDLTHIFYIIGIGYIAQKCKVAFCMTAYCFIILALHTFRRQKN